MIFVPVPVLCRSVPGVAFDKIPLDRQANARPGEVALVLETAEWLEQVRAMVIADACPSDTSETGIMDAPE